jgi:hypothetical protein
MALHLLPPDLDSYEAAVDEVVAACDGDLRGALTALIVANEFLERDLQEALASATAPSIADSEDPGRPVNWIQVRKLATALRRNDNFCQSRECMHSDANLPGLRRLRLGVRKSSRQTLGRPARLPMRRRRNALPGLQHK